MIRRWLAGLVALVVVVGGGLYAIGRGALGEHEGPGEVTATARPAASDGAVGAGAKQILFGDLHVHTTFSADAFVMSLPLVSGEGAHPPADACDFARFCSQLDFWSINDHAESLTPTHWQETVQSIRECNAVTDAGDPDVVAFLGWEWTHDGDVPSEHWGHKNVVLRSIEEGDVPVRPIGAKVPGGDIVVLPALARAGVALVFRDQRTWDFTRFVDDSVSTPICPDGVPVRALPRDCKELTDGPAELFAKLDDWGVDSIVIPHGTTWGNTAPPGASWDRQIGSPAEDPGRQTLVEVYSGHGNSEEFRDFADVEIGPGGEATCPPPVEGRDGFLPNCWRAGEIVAERCRAEGEDSAECERRAATARRNHVEAGKVGFRTISGAPVEEWQDAGQCRGCFTPAFDYRPRMSAQYMLARRRFDGDSVHAVRMGFIASSDNHTARPGTGYKERDRSEMTEGKGTSADVPDLLGNERPRLARSVSLAEQPEMPFASRDIERMASFFTTGGLVAVHATGRTRDQVWSALRAREVYGTSGDRILLWFDVLAGAAGQSAPMGAEVVRGGVPRFRVRAVGARLQKAGCPDFARAALGEQRLYDLCRDECHHPSDERKAITRIEVVRIRPQVRQDEPIAALVEDPWRVLECPGDATGCQVEFDDPEFPTTGRETVYYVRAIEEPSMAVNGANLRCEYDPDGRCRRLVPCHGNDGLTEYEDDCLSEIEERAWSSPIWVTPVAAVDAASVRH